MTLPNARSPRQVHHRRAQGFVPNGDAVDNGAAQDGGAAASTSTPAAQAAVSTTTPATTTTPVVRPTSAAPTTTAAALTTSAAPTTTRPLTTTTPLTTLPATTSAAVTTSAAPTIATVPTTRAAVTTPLVTTPVASRTFTSASYKVSTASATSTAAAASGGPAVGSIIGIVGGGLVGVVVLAAIAGYFFRRASRRSKDNFNKADFMRNSMAIADDEWKEKPVIGSKNALALARANSFQDGPSATPRPPTMIERRQNTFQPGEVINPAQGAYYQDPQAAAYYNYGAPAPAAYGAAQYDYNQYGQYAGQQQYTNAYTPPTEHQQSELTRKPSAPMGRPRGPADASPEEFYAANSPVVDDQYYPPPVAGTADRHESVTPFQQQQYAEISRQLNVPAPAVTADTTNLGRSLSTTYSSLNPQAPAKTYTEPEKGNRSGTPTDNNPQQTYYNPPAGATPRGGALTAPQQAAHRQSVYDDDDAYGGI